MVSYYSVEHSLYLLFTLYTCNPVKCISPFRLLTEANKQLVIINYSCPAIQGTIAVFSCSSCGYELTGPSTSTCMGNGKWIPDPGQMQCEGKVSV